jgi:hypothetical protein
LPGRDIPADERVELEHAREDVRDVRVTEEHHTQAAAGTFEKFRPITLDLTIHQHIEADAVPVEPQALVEVLDDDNRVMNRTRDRSTLPTPHTRVERDPKPKETEGT